MKRTRRMEWNDIDELIGKTFTRVERDGEGIAFYDDANNYMVTIKHYQSCCESVYIRDLIGDLDDLTGVPIETAVEAIKGGEDDEYGISAYTFYTFRTIKGTVDVDWHGSSNGYYSVSVEIESGPMVK